MKINLIPEIKREQLKIRSLNILVTNIAIGAAIVLGGLLVILTVYMGGRAVEIKSIDSQTATLKEQLKTYESLEKTVISIEQGVKEVNQILTSNDQWDAIFAMFETATPSDIRFVLLSISPELQVTAELEGRDVNSIDRFIKSFKNYKTGNNQAFTDLDVSGYSVNDKGLVSFSSTFKINAEALKK